MLFEAAYALRTLVTRARDGLPPIGRKDLSDAGESCTGHVGAAACFGLHDF